MNSPLSWYVKEDVQGGSAFLPDRQLSVGRGGCVDR